MAVSLTEQDREAIRYHLGYHNTEATASINLGFPSSNQQLFILETSMDRVINQSAVSRIMRIVNELNSIEAQMSEARKRFKAQQLGELKLRNSNDEASETDLLRQEYRDWVGMLSSQLSAPINVNGNPRLRPIGGGGGMGGSYRIKNRG